jgi:hypothetical protein
MFPLLEHWYVAALLRKGWFSVIESSYYEPKAKVSKRLCANSDAAAPPVRKWIRHWEDIHEDLQRLEALEVSHRAYYRAKSLHTRLNQQESESWRSD